MGDLINLQKAGYSLVLGGARSGKSTYAESVIENVGGGFYIATSEALDEEMTARIAVHRERRGDDWQTLEEPVLLQHALLSIKGRGKPALVDCLTLWLSNLMELEKNIEAEIDGLCVWPKNWIIQLCLFRTKSGRVLSRITLWRAVLPIAPG